MLLSFSTRPIPVPIIKNIMKLTCDVEWPCMSPRSLDYKHEVFLFLVPLRATNLFLFLRIFPFPETHKIFSSFSGIREIKGHIQNHVTFTHKVTYEGYTVVLCVFELREPRKPEKQ